jgi:hypothetical protein
MAKKNGLALRQLYGKLSAESRKVRKQDDSLVAFARRCREDFGIEPLPETLDPVTGRRRPLGFYLEKQY